MEEETVSPKAKWMEKGVDGRIGAVLVLVIGVLAGFAVKTEASHRITMGSGDYLVAQQLDSKVYDLNAIQRDLTMKGEGSSIAPPQAAGGSCGQ